MNTVDRKIRRLGNVFVVLFAIIAAFLGYWQIFDASQLVALPENQIHSNDLKTIHRGAIYDRNGRTLAQTIVNPDGSLSRTYPLPSIAALLGYHSFQRSNTGLEQAYDSFLSGSAPGQPADDIVRRLLHQPVIGDDLHLTIDARIQKIIVDTMGSGPGACIVADPRTGEILGLESQPWVDPNLIDNDLYMNQMNLRTDSPFVDRALQGLYPPGSVFKAVTLAAAYQSGLYTPQTVISGTDAVGPLYIDNYPLYSTADNLPPGTLAVTPVEAFKYSDNIAFASMGLAVGPSALLQTSASFGFGSGIPFDLPVKKSIVTANPSTFSGSILAKSAFGQQDVLATPMQMLMVDEAIANGGGVNRPYVVASITGSGNTIVRQTNPLSWTMPISQSIASEVKDAMVAVVEAQGGSGFMAKVPGVTVAGKTGTAEATGGLPHAWFMAFAPAERPRLAVIVFKEHGGDGYLNAAPIAGSILQQSLPLLK